MLLIRLQRVGRANQGSFRIIVTPKRSAPRGKPIEFLGWWDPRVDKVNWNTERISYWLSKGAKPSPTLHNLLVSHKVIEGKKVPVHKKKKETTPPATGGETTATTQAAKTTTEAATSEPAPSGSTKEVESSPPES
jgi:small subunit ribosomal protein S16